MKFWQQTEGDIRKNWNFALSPLFSCQSVKLKIREKYIGAISQGVHI